MRIAGSLWSVPPGEQSAQLGRALRAGLGAVHWDATDGVFAAAGGFAPPSALALLPADGPVVSEAHLMMRDPRAVVPAWLDFCSLIAVPVESEHASEAASMIEGRGGQPALAVSLETPLSSVPTDYPVLLMSVVPGQAGSRFDPAVVARVAALRDRGRNPLIGVDGGVGPVHFTALARAGANWIVSGTSLFSAADQENWIVTCRAAFSREAVGPHAAGPGEG